MRSAVVRSKNRDQLSIYPKRSDAFSTIVQLHASLGFVHGICAHHGVFFVPSSGFVEASTVPPYTFWFIYNRALDLLFIKDCLIHFTLMHPKHDSMMDTGLQWNVTWERDRKRIAMSYLRGWFFVDFVSCIPFDIIAAEADDDGLYTNLRLLRIVRILRIAKLLKILDGGRQFKRFERWLSLRHTVAETVGVVVTMVFCAHWTACLWMLIVSLERDAAGGDHSHTWVSMEGFDSYEYRIDPNSLWPLDPYKMYPVCLYWSMRTDDDWIWRHRKPNQRCRVHGGKFRNDGGFDYVGLPDWENLDAHALFVPE